MKIDLHIHTSTGSDGGLPIDEVFRAAGQRGIGLISVTDHDAIDHQGQAINTATEYGLQYISGVELNVTFPCRGKSVSLDFLGYGYDYTDRTLLAELQLIKERRGGGA